MPVLSVAYSETLGMQLGLSWWLTSYGPPIPAFNTFKKTAKELSINYRLIHLTQL